MRIINLLPAILTPIITIVTVYLAIQQYRANKLKVRHDLYEKRVEVYSSTLDFITLTWSDDFKADHLRAFIVTMRKSQFLFGPEVHEYLSTIIKMAYGTLTERASPEGIITPELEELLLLSDEGEYEFEGDLAQSECKKVFRKYLSLDSLR